MDKNELKDLAQKYLDGTATPSEKQLLNEWYDTIHIDSAEMVDLAEAETEEDIQQRILGRINIQRGTEETVETSRRVFPMRKIAAWVGAAAAVLIMFLFARTLYRQNEPAQIAAADRQLVNVPSNRVRRITLPDGSTVSLNVGTVFRYPKNFTGKTREVELVEGQAFFDIKHETEHPFIVKTKNLNVTVLGTSFDVSSYKKTGNTRVSVVTGKVGITMPDEADKTTIMLLPNQQLILSNKTAQLLKQTVPGTDVIAWTKNNFVFEQETLGNVFKALEEEYDTKIKVENPKLLDEKITINISNQHLDTIMQILSYTSHFKYQMANDSTLIVK